MFSFRQYLSLLMLWVVLFSWTTPKSVMAAPATLADTSPPTLSYTVAPNTTFTNGNVLFTGTATDNVAVKGVYCRFVGESAWTGGGASCTLTATQNTKVEFYAIDTSNNTSPTSVVSICSIDKAAPTWALTPVATELGGAKNEGYVSGPYDASFTFPSAADPTRSCNGSSLPGSGLSGYYLYWGSDPAGTSTTFRTTTVYDPPAAPNGTYYLRLQTKDFAGNLGAWTTLFTLNVGDDLPTVTASANPPASTWTNSTVVVSLSASDQGSGVNRVEYAIDGGSTVDVPGASASVTLTTNGTLVYDAVDNGGNRAGQNSLLVCNIDKGAPGFVSGTPAAIETSANAANNSIVPVGFDPSFSLPATVDPAVSCGAASPRSGSGVKGVLVYWGTDSTGMTTTQQTSTAYNPPAISSQGVYYLREAIVDNAGNTSAWTTIFTLRATSDSQPPVVSYLLSPAGWTNGSTQVTVSATDASSGVKTVSCSKDNVTWANGASSCSLTFTDNGLFYYFAEDNSANKTTTAQVGVCNIDKGSPLFNQGTYATEAGGLVTGGTLTASRTLNFKIPAAVEPSVYCAATQNTMGSGVDGYFVSFGQDVNGTSSTMQAGTDFATGQVTQNGTYYLRVAPHDAAGNTGAWAQLFTFTANIAQPADTTPPQVGAVFTPTTWTTGDVQVQITATDNESGVKEVHCGTGGSMEVVQGASCTVTLTRNGMVSYKAVDKAGNTSPIQTTEVCNIDKSAPLIGGVAVEASGVTTGALVGKGFDPAFTLPRVMDPFVGSCRNVLEWPGSGFASFDVYWGTDPAGTAPAVNQIGKEVNPDVLNSLDSYYLRISVKDKAGNVSPWTTVFNLNVEEQDSSAHVPVATISAIRGIVAGKVKGMVTFRGTASDEDGDLAWVKYSADDGRTWTVLEIDSQTGGFSFEWDSAKARDGALDILVQAGDQGGRTGVAALTLEIDNWLEVFLPTVIR